MVSFVLTCAFLQADQTTGVIRVAVAQAADDRASVEATTSDEPSRRWSAEARGPQTATIQGLPPATYRVVVTFASGAVATLDVVVGAAEVVSIAGQPTPATAGQTPLAVVDRRRLAQGTYFDAREMRELPAGSGVAGLLDAASPFVIADRFDAGGLALGTAPRVGSRGASWTDASPTLGEFAVARGPQGADQLALWPDLAALEAVSVGSGLASPEVAAPGAMLTFVPRRPRPVREGTVDASFTAPGMVSSNNSAGIPPIASVDSWKSASVTFGGPIAPRMGLFVAGTASALDKRERGAPALVPSDVSSVFAHLVANPGERTQVRLLASAESVGRPAWGENPFHNVDLRERDTFLDAQTSWDHQASDGSRLELSASVQRGRFTPSDTPFSGGVIDRVLDGIMPPSLADDTTTRSEGRLVFALPEIRRHALEAGLTFARSTSSSNLRPVAVVAELVDGLPARIWVPIQPATGSARQAHHIAAYVTDRVAVARNLTLDLGVRVARSAGSATGAAQSIAWGAVLPRLSFRWTSSAATLFGGYGRYQPEVSLDLLAFGDPGEPAIDVYRWNDTNANGQFDPGEMGALVERAGRGPSVASIDPALRAPHTDEFVLGAERAVGRRMRLTASAIVRREHDLLRSVNVGVSTSSYHQILVPDQGENYDSPVGDHPLAIYDRLPSSFGLDRFLLTTSSAEQASYAGIEVDWRYDSVRWWSMAGASAYRTDALGGNRGFRSNENDQGVIGEVFENANAAFSPTGRLFFDRSYVLKWSTGYHGPHDIRAAVIARYQDGQPFSRLVIAQGLAQGPEVVSAYSPGRTRFTFTGTIDARLEKGFRLGSRHAALRLDLFNIANLGYEVEENAVTGPGFRNTTAVQPPRTLQFGFHVEF